MSRRLQETANDRVRSAMKGRNMKQKELAAELGVTAAAVSQYLAGEIPPDRLEQIARALNVSSQWLTTGGPPVPEFIASLRQQQFAEKNYGWVFRPAPYDGGRSYGNSNVWALPWDVATFVRESAQNVLDVAVDPETGVDLRYSLIRLTGDDLRTFREALRFGRPDTADIHHLAPHLQASSTNKQKLGLVLSEGLELLQTRDELILLRVEDRRTTGLTGEEHEPGNFSALTRNDLDSNKVSDTAGGSYGLGKAVFQRASRYATVLFHSRYEDSAKGKGMHSRVIGRSDLAFHLVGADDRFAGPGWFGQTISDGKNERAESVWDDADLVEALHLDRATDESGTSILVVGFYDPSDDSKEHTDLRSLAQKLSEAVAHNFWPALVFGRLTATVEIYEGRDQQYSEQVRVEDHQAINAQMLLAHLEDRTVEQATGPEDVVARRIPLHLPKRRSSSGRHDALTHEAVLLVRRLGEEDPQQQKDQVACLRGNGMIIQTRTYRQVVLGARPYQAVLLCGQAAGDEADDVAAERFLRTSEPPAHNKWEVTPDLKSEYALGGGRAIEAMFEQVRQTIRDLVKPEHTHLDDGPESLRNLLRVGNADDGPGSKPGRAPRIIIDGRRTALDTQHRWVVHGEIIPPDRRSWRVLPTLKFNLEGGGGQRVRWLELVALEGCELRDGALVVNAGARRAKFRGVSDPATHPIAATEVTVTVGLEGVRPEEGENA